MRSMQYMVGLVAFTLFLGVVWGADAENPREALMPGGASAVVEVHHLHKEKSAACAACHPKAASSRWASDRLVPAMESCIPCHPDAENVSFTTPFGEKCTTCHGPRKKGERPVRGYYPRPNIRFSHLAHAKKQIPCGTCHPLSASRQKTDTFRDMPEMRQCYECHQKSKEASAECRVCHILHKDGRLVTRWNGVSMIPPTWLKGPTHGPEWAGSHAHSAAADSRFCGSCHRESFCRDCHSGRRRPRKIHPGDWLTTHGINTRLDTPRCRGCHRKQSFCITCHRRSGVAPDSPAGSRSIGGIGRYHNQMDTRTLMRRARSAVTSCVSCHSEGKCITCHTRQNPHPPNFRRQCRALANRNRRVCAKCHRDAPWTRCR